MKTPVHIAVTGAAGQINYALLFRLAAGDLLGPDQPVVLRLLEIPEAMPSLIGLIMELEDCAFPLLRDVIATTDAREAFREAEYAFLVGARPRGPGMQRKDLLQVNARIFATQGRTLNEYAPHHVKVLVVGNPANTNALIAVSNAPDLSARNFTAMSRLDHNRSVSLLARRCGVSVTDVTRVTVWGNHSCTQYPDLHHALVGGQRALDRVDMHWYVDEYIPAVQQRGAAIIAARGRSSAASAASAALDHMRNWIEGTPPGDWVSMTVASDGSYGIEPGLMFSFPVTVTDGAYQIVQGLEMNEFSRRFLLVSEKELQEERNAVADLL